MGTNQLMRWVGVLSAVVLGALVLAGAVLAATEVPKVTNLRATPATFCAKKSSGCANPGTTVRFTISTDARVRGDIRPRREYQGSFVEFVKNLHKGANAVRLNDSRLKPGRWTIRVQATNNVGSGPIAVTDVHVVKRK
jgi:hypothetical protein